MVAIWCRISRDASSCFVPPSSYTSVRDEHASRLGQLRASSLPLQRRTTPTAFQHQSTLPIPRSRQPTRERTCQSTWQPCAQPGPSSHDDNYCSCSGPPHYHLSRDVRARRACEPDAPRAVQHPDEVPHVAHLDRLALLAVEFALEPGLAGGCGPCTPCADAGNATFDAASADLGAAVRIAGVDADACGARERERAGEYAVASCVYAGA